MGAFNTRLVFTAIFASLGAPARSAETEGARTFVETVIAYQEAQTDSLTPDNTPFLGPRFRRAIERDRSGEGDETGWLDHDPLCMCQDPDGLKYEVISIDGNDYAAIATISVAGNRAQWHLIHLAEGWKLADISEYVGGGEEAIPSVLSALEIWAGFDERQIPYVECMPTAEECSFLRLDMETDRDRQLIYYICGTDASMGSVDRYFLLGVEGFAAITCRTERATADVLP